MGLDPLEKLIIDLESEGAGFSGRHGFVTSIFFQVEVFGDQGCDVLAGGLARLVLGLGNFAVQIEINLSTKIFGGRHDFALLIEVLG